MTRLIALIACLACSVADAQSVRIVSTISTTESSTLRGYGSGTVIGKLRDGSHAVLTAAHVIKDAQNVNVVFDGTAGTVSNPARVLLVSYDKESDVALLSVRLVGVNVCKVAGAFPRRVVQVRAEGFPQQFRKRDIQTEMDGDILTTPSQLIEEGMSGGGVIYKGELVGVITGRIVGRRDGWHTPSRFISPWLISELGYLPR